ncbi:Hypothetical Protein RradSPS_0283 [Rubrobacter radiotolerans]|uniref:Uncharacterized protein n=1 Tax=Rubrobacter radiotolerans TaxID=42256 RepID=A0A023X074_RUBRA|nr:hypothetical protein [Rubrobacter radiotolerans]AHY45566.1 Hypothetical Protein RradSPS_0283 [Rubrobacter radiotolerans]MDX5892980.1 hypothetical protein [Rubrobacter radiotolerans]SMC02849.1 conserved hypothetical protein [Rubrobacter radiotolerans DSM 5868]
MVRGRFFGKEPPRVPDPGQRVRLLGADDKWRMGFRAISGPLSDDSYGVVVWVAEEEEWETATLKRRAPVGMAWPLDRMEVVED